MTESSTALNPDRIYFSKLTNTVPGCVAVEPLWMHASVRGNATLTFAVSSFTIFTFTFSSLILELPAHKYSKHRRFTKIYNVRRGFLKGNFPGEMYST